MNWIQASATMAVCLIGGICGQAEAQVPPEQVPPIDCLTDQLHTGNGQNSLTCGLLTTATGANSTTFGHSSVATAANVTALGTLASGTGVKATAVGTLSSASGTNSLAVGSESTASAPTASRSAPIPLHPRQTASRS